MGSRLKIAKRTFIRILLMSLIILILNLGFLLYQTPWLMDMHSIEILEVGTDKRVVGTEYGTIIANLEEYNIDYIQLEKIPSKVVESFIAVEDARFYQHRGLDYWGIMRAVWSIVSEQNLQGGSTITQQLARNIFLSHERTINRKLDELVITVQLERQFTKDQILEMYLNQIHFGKQYYGIGRASKAYFDKDLDQLTLGEIAILAGMPKGPNLFFPTADNSERALMRQQIVLNRLMDMELISAVEAQEAYDYLAELLASVEGEQ